MPAIPLFATVPLLLASTLSVRALLPFAFDAFAGDPETRIEDAYKWIYQAANGGEHAIPDEDSARAWLRKEWASLGPSLPGEPLVVPLRPDGAVVRVNLRPYRDRSGKEDALLAAFLESARAFEPDSTLFRESWTALGKQLDVRPLGPLNRAEWTRLDSALRTKGYPAVHHSDGFTRARHPAYRILTGEEATRLVRTLPFGQRILPCCAGPHPPG